MPTSITLTDLTYRTPDGQPLFESLNLSFGPQRTGLIGRNGTGKSTILKLITGELTPAGGQVTVNGTLGLLRQSVQVETGATLAQALGIDSALARLERLDAGTGSLEDAGEADWTLTARLSSALAQTGLPDLDPHRPLMTLSGGQRTRLALAALLLEAPDMILLDEPTNNLDADGRAAVAHVLAGWRGGAIVVSHDRGLLRQMDAIVELTTLGARSYGGNWDYYLERKALELAAAEHGLATAERKMVEIDRRVQAQVERKAKKDAAGARKRAKGDAPKILMNAMRNRAQETSGENARLANRMREEAAEAAAEARAQVEVLQPLTVRLASTGLPAGKTVVQADSLTGGPDPDDPVIQDLSFTIIGPECVAVTGPNGSGKTSLLRLLVGELAPVSGALRILSTFAMLDQTVSILDPRQTIRDNYRRLNPDEDENACRAALARFMFRADAALQVAGTLSGGEILRAGLAATIGGRTPPQLLILDEPTNHLDISAIEAVEAGLKAYDGALLVVSHDRTFLENIGIGREIALG